MEDLECSKQCLMNDSGQTSEDQKVDMNVEGKDQAQRFHLQTRASLAVGRQTDHLRCTLVENLYMFSPCSESFQETD